MIAQQDRFALRSIECADRLVQLVVSLPVDQVVLRRRLPLGVSLLLVGAASRNPFALKVAAAVDRDAIHPGLEAA